MRSTGYSRKDFLKMIKNDAYLENEESKQFMFQICTKLRNCTDLLPKNARTQLDKSFQSLFDSYEDSPPARTYGQAARRIKAILDGSSRKYLIRPTATGGQKEEIES